MNVVVCVKQVDNDLNPFDACALECALSLKNAEITLLSMGRESVKNMLKKYTRLGVRKAILLNDNAYAGSDTLATSYVLSLAIRKLNPDLVLCGRQSIDSETSQVGPSLAQKLDIPCITNVLKICNVDTFVSCITRMGAEICNLPVLLTIERINNLRFPSVYAKTSEAIV